MEHAMELAERVMQARIRKVLDISEEQYGLRPERGTAYAILIVQQI